ncbi:MAG TPA: hypothetical protein VKM36_01365 [Balneolaceae bacterium]|nr:hypothetical protein [Balneolaceae bacterium]
MNLSTDIHSIFVLVLALFTLASTFLAAYSIANTLRLRNIRMSWKRGKLAGYPVFSTSFLAVSLIMAGIVYMNGLNQYYIISACYIWISISWFTSSYLASLSFISDYGIVKNINDPSQTVAWHQITDLVEKQSKNGSTILFMYQKKINSEQRLPELVRLELFVPDEKEATFQKILHYKLGNTIENLTGKSIDVKTFE